MKKAFLLSLKILAGIVAVCIVLILGTVGLFHTSWVQEKAVEKATRLLSERLKTKVEIGYVNVSLFGQDVNIGNVTIEDLQHRKMLQMKELGLDVDLWRLLRRELYVTQAKVKGLEARIHKPATDSDSVANYQFVIEAFKKKKPDEQVAQPEKKAQRHRLTFDVAKLDLEDIGVSYNDTMQARLGGLHFRKSWKGHQTAVVKELTAAFVQHTKKGPVDSRVRLGFLEIKTREEAANDSMLSSLTKDLTPLMGAEVTVDSLCFFTDNHKPRKNVGKKHRGFWDEGHLDIVAKMHLRLDSIGKDTVTATLTDCDAVDRGSGLHVTNITCKMAANKKTANLKNVVIKMANTTLSFDHGFIQLPSKKQGRKLFYQTSVIKGRTLLKDIARPFAPVLSQFTLPVYLSTTMSGDDDNIHFRHVNVFTPRQALQVNAVGDISGLKDKYKLKVQFRVSRMHTTGMEAERIINQFPLKRKFMMKQLETLGGISYHGHFEVLWRREQFAGTLQTAQGPINFQFALDENNKYVFGTTQTDSFELGKAMDMPDLGKIACKANFRFDISKPRTAVMRKKLGGKLPIGHVDAEVAEAKYKKIKVRNLFADINSNGAVADGKITIKGKRVDLLCSFTFTNTNEMKKTKIKPGIRFHKLSEEDRKLKEERKAEKRQAKALEAQAKAEEKAQRKATKDSLKAVKANEKALRKAAKDSLKAIKKQEKAARKAAQKQEE